MTKTHCLICGEHYASFVPGIKSEDAIAMVRSANDREEGGAFISRGPVLWAMRVLKLGEWFTRHLECPIWADEFPGAPPWAIWRVRFAYPPDQGDLEVAESLSTPGAPPQLHDPEEEEPSGQDLIPF